MTTALMNLWSRSMDIATGSPEVVVRRVGGMMNPAAAWTPASAVELQCMLLEKVEATVETCWAVFRNMLSFGSLAQWQAPAWWLPANQQQVSDKLVGAANQIMLPFSERVSANVERLRADA